MVLASADQIANYGVESMRVTCWALHDAVAAF